MELKTRALREEIEQQMEENARKYAKIAEIKAEKDATIIEKDAEIARLKLLLKDKK